MIQVLPIVLFFATFISSLIPYAASQCDYSLIRGSVGTAQYSICVDGVEDVRDCPPYAVFDGEKCVGTPFQCPQSEGTFSHADSHLMYYACRNGAPIRYFCTTGQVFNGQSCANVLVHMISNDRSVRYIFDCPSDGTFKDKDNRHNYIVCKNGQAFVHQCPRVVVEQDSQQNWTKVFNGDNCVTPYECPEIHGMKKHVLMGWQLYSCHAGQRYHHSCPDGQSYNGQKCEMDFLIQNPYKCPEINGYFANQYNESQYYHCVNDMPALMECPANERFSGHSCLAVRVMSSDGVAPVRTHHRLMDDIITDEDTVRTQRLSPTFRCVYDGVFADPSSKTRFILCRNGRPYVEQCPIVGDGRKRWYEVFDGRQCVAPYDCPEIDGTSKLTPNGRVYFQCSNGQAVQFVCPQGQTFDGQSCVGGEQIYFRCPHSDGLYRHPSNDREYYECVNYRPVLKACPADARFDGQSCVDSGQTHFRCPHSDGLYRHPANDREYYECINYRPVLKVCPADSTFDGQSCIDLGQTQFRCPYSDGLYRHPANDREYYECVNYRPVLKACPADATFDGQSCVASGQIYFRCPHSDGLYRHPTNDREYYECVNYRPVLRSCPADSVFDGQSCSGGHVRPHDHYRLLVHNRNMVEFEFRDKHIVDTLNEIERKWDRVIRDIVAK